ncbi:MAG: hypothetical protein MUC41_19030 [Syntrophobacteraceae bacterium]|nr:hypothetical protein [Syntrophobacteraceae bacterium]
MEVEIQLYERSRAAILNLATSRAWTWQQGAMTQWLDGGRVIFNDVVNGMLCSRIVDTQGREEQVIPFPVQTLHPDGRGALSLNYRRLFRLRPEYGYAAEVRNFSPDQALEHDGIWQVDLASGRGDLLVSLAELMEAEPREGMSWEMTKVNHVIVSPTGRHCLFMHRWFGPRGKHSRLYVMNWDGSGRRILLDTGMISHYHWKDDRSVVVYGRDLRGKDGYLLLDVETGHGQPLSGGALDGFGDGHPSFGPGGEWLVTDSYPDREYMQYLVVHRPSRGDLQVVARMRHSPRYAGATRCDLHPRWSRGGNMLSVDSVCHGSRRSFIVDVSSMVAQEGHGETLCRRDS